MCAMIITVLLKARAIQRNIALLSEVFSTSDLIISSAMGSHGQQRHLYIVDAQSLQQKHHGGV